MASSLVERQSPKDQVSVLLAYINGRVAARPDGADALVTGAAAALAPLHQADRT